MSGRQPPDLWRWGWRQKGCTGPQGAFQQQKGKEPTQGWGVRRVCGRRPPFLLPDTGSPTSFLDHAWVCGSSQDARSGPAPRTPQLKGGVPHALSPCFRPLNTGSGPGGRQGREGPRVQDSPSTSSPPHAATPGPASTWRGSYALRRRMLGGRELEASDGPKGTRTREAGR